MCEREMSLSDAARLKGELFRALLQTLHGGHAEEGLEVAGFHMHYSFRRFGVRKHTRPVSPPVSPPYEAPTLPSPESVPSLVATTS